MFNAFNPELRYIPTADTTVVMSAAKTDLSMNTLNRHEAAELDCSLTNTNHPLGALSNSQRSHDIYCKVLRVT